MVKLNCINQKACLINKNYETYTFELLHLLSETKNDRMKCLIFFLPYVLLSSSSVL